MNQWNKYYSKENLQMGNEPEIISNRNLNEEQPRMADF